MVFADARKNSAKNRLRILTYVFWWGKYLSSFFRILICNSLFSAHLPLTRPCLSRKEPFEWRLKLAYIVLVFSCSYLSSRRRLHQGRRRIPAIFRAMERSISSTCSSQSTWCLALRPAPRSSTGREYATLLLSSASSIPRSAKDASSIRTACRYHGALASRPTLLGITSTGRPRIVDHTWRSRRPSCFGRVMLTLR